MSERMTRRSMTALAGSAVATFMVNPALAAPARRQVPFVMGAGAFYFIVHYVAEAGGFIEAEGLQLDSINMSSGPRQVAAIMGGSADAGPFGLQLVIQAAQRDGGIVAISAGYNVLPMSVVLSGAAMTRAGIEESMSTDEKVRRMKGLRIGITTPGSGTDDMVRALLRKRGMDGSKDLTIQPLVSAEGMLAALERGASDGFCFTSPIIEMAVSRGLGKIVIEPLRGDVPEAADVPYIILATNRETLASKRPVLLGLVRAHTKAMELVRREPEQASKLVRRYFPDIDETLYRTAFDKYRAGVPTTPLISREQVGNVVQFMQISKGEPVAAKYEDVVDPSLAKEVLG